MWLLVRSWNCRVKMLYVCMYEKFATVTVSIEETVPLGQGERGPDRDSYFPNPVS